MMMRKIQKQLNTKKSNSENLGLAIAAAKQSNRNRYPTNYLFSWIEFSVLVNHVFNIHVYAV